MFGHYFHSGCWSRIFWNVSIIFCNEGSKKDKCSSLFILLELDENPVMCCGKNFWGTKNIGHWDWWVERGKDVNFLISFRRVSCVNLKLAEYPCFSVVLAGSLLNSALKPIFSVIEDQCSGGQWSSKWLEDYISKQTRVKLVNKQPRDFGFIKFYAVLELFEANTGLLQNVYWL